MQTGGSYIEPQNVERGKAAVCPANPARQGYTFTGWYRDSTLLINLDCRYNEISSLDLNNNVALQLLRSLQKADENHPKEKQVQGVNYYIL